ncbi:hypothetical protein IJF85_01465 [Candidatus Saccharibacteria bacterium]|nr:hypothetical protein [Candidatus Saccharibacteria bacterium]
MFYVKNEAGEFVEASEHDIDELFREKSDKIISSKLAKAKEKQSDEIRAEITAKVQSEEREKIKTELRDEIESEWQKKLDVANTKNEELDVALRRKTIAAEYGFKPELEKYLGTGTDEDMRKEADTLKSSFDTGSKFRAPEKTPEKAGGSFVKLTKE